MIIKHIKMRRPHVFVGPTKSYRKKYVENSKGVIQSQIITFIFLINSQSLTYKWSESLRVGSRHWSNTRFFRGFSLFCSLIFTIVNVNRFFTVIFYNYFIVPNLQGAPMAPNSHCRCPCFRKYQN